MSTFLYYGEFAHYGYCENWIAAALDRNGHHCVRVQRVKWFDEQRLLAIARQERADYLLLSKTPEIEAAQLRTIREAGLKIVFWTFDWMRHPDNWKWYGPLSEESDFCFQTDGYVHSHAAHKIELHQGYEPGLHDLPDTSAIVRTRQNGGLECDVVFIGSTYTERRKTLVRRLSVRYGREFSKYGEPDVQLWGQAFAEACYLSKIVVGDNFVNDVPGYWSDRVYLTLACGGFFLTAYVEGLEREFKNHEHLVWWRNFEELDELIAYYLPREAERRAIALNGYRLVHVRDSYDHRIRKMTEILEGR